MTLEQNENVKNNSRNLSNKINKTLIKDSDKDSVKIITEESTRRISLKEVAPILSVSTATVRNWMKAGKLEKVISETGTLFLDQGEVLKLKEEIESGASHRLKSRRNKRAVEGNYIPTEYVATPEYIRLTEDILEWVNQVEVPIDPRLILFEISLQLLRDKGVLSDLGCLERDKDALSSGSSEGLSLTEQVLQKQLNLGSYHDLLLQLWDFEEAETIEEGISQEVRTVLRNVQRSQIHWVRGDDLLGLVYMALSNLATRKSKGSYYTPTKLVDQLVQQSLEALGKVDAPKIIDPCCGSGNFLIKMYIALVKKMEELGGSSFNAERQLLESVLYGYDIDSIAVTLTQINLAFLLESSLKKEQALTSLLQSLQCNIQQKNSLESYGTLFEASIPIHYDLVIGNPPWGYHFSKDEVETYRKNFISAEASMESFSLFIEYGLSLLKPQGLLAFVLPEALLNVKIHSSIRKLLLEQTKILEINLLGHQFTKVFTPTITLLVRRCTDSQESVTDDHDHSLRVHLDKETHTIPQKRFLENSMWIFNVKALNQEEAILEHMRGLSGSKFLAGNADFALGIVTGNNKEFILEQPFEGAESILKGNDIYKYNYDPKENYIVFQPEKYQQVAPVALYRAPEKLIYRFINENLVFAYDNCQTLSLNSANIVIPRLSGYSMKYIMAVFNSRAAQFFHTSSFSSVKVLRKHIESLPIPPCSSEVQEKIIDWVDTLMKVKESSRRVEIYEEIDEMVMNLYALTKEQQDIIRTKFQVVKHLSPD